MHTMTNHTIANIHRTIALALDDASPNLNLLVDRGMFSKVRFVFGSEGGDKKIGVKVLLRNHSSKKFRSLRIGKKMHDALFGAEEPVDRYVLVVWSDEVAMFSWEDFKPSYFAKNSRLLIIDDKEKGYEAILRAKNLVWDPTYFSIRSALVDVLNPTHTIELAERRAGI